MLMLLCIHLLARMLPHSGNAQTLQAADRVWSRAAALTARLRCARGFSVACAALRSPA